MSLLITACGGSSRHTRNTSSSNEDDWWNTYSRTNSNGSSSITSNTTTVSFESLEENSYLIHMAKDYDEVTVKEKYDYNVIFSNVYGTSSEDDEWSYVIFQRTTENTISFFSNSTESVTVDLTMPLPGEYWVQIGEYQVGGTHSAKFLNQKPSSPYYDNRTNERHYIINVPEEYDHYYCWGAYWTSEWPGDPLVNHQAIFTATYDGVVNIIFNYQGMIQTSDLSLPLEGGTYTWNGNSFIRG